MKQSIFNYISKIVSSSSPKSALKITNFHPTFFGPLIRCLDVPVVVAVEDSDFAPIYKYLSRFWNDDSVVFLNGPLKIEGPAGFLSSVDKLTIRAGALLSKEKGIKIVFYTKSGCLQKIINRELNYIDLEIGVNTLCVYIRTVDNL